MNQDNTLIHIDVQADPPIAIEIREEYAEKLSLYFVCEEEIDGPSSLWTCWKK